jgi:hypothetical protein
MSTSEISEGNNYTQIGYRSAESQPRHWDTLVLIVPIMGFAVGNSKSTWQELDEYPRAIQFGRQSIAR